MVSLSLMPNGRRQLVPNIMPFISWVSNDVVITGASLGIFIQSLGA